MLQFGMDDMTWTIVSLHLEESVTNTSVFLAESFSNFRILHMRIQMAMNSRNVDLKLISLVVTQKAKRTPKHHASQ